jgi:hypothetical protein
MFQYNTNIGSTSFLHKLGKTWSVFTPGLDDINMLMYNKKHKLLYTAHETYMKHMQKMRQASNTTSAEGVSNFKSTSRSRKRRKVCDQFFVYTLLAARFSLLAGFSWLQLLLAFLQPCAL